MSTAERIKVETERVNQVPTRIVVLEEPDCKQFGKRRPCLTNANIAGFRLTLLAELEGVDEESAQGSTREEREANMRLKRLD